MNKMMEIWKPIDGYDGNYEVSNYGNIRRGDHIKSLSVWNAYKVVTLYKDGKPKTMYVHRIVAKAFLPNPLKKQFVNHIDCNKLNNHADNLEWCTRQENEIHAWAHGLKERIRETSKANAIIAREHVNNKISVTQFALNGDFIRVWDSATDAMRETGIDGSAITKCCRGKMDKTGGFRWAYTP